MHAAWGIGAVLWGEAGIGRSHLLGRLSRWAHQDLNACFVYLHNLQASPENLPRSLLKSVRILRRLMRDVNPPEQVLLITDERVPFALGVIGKKYYGLLQQRGEASFRLVQVTFAHYAELDALQAAVTAARSKDLEVEMAGPQTHAVTEREVRDPMLATVVIRVRRSCARPWHCREPPISSGPISR